MKRHVANPVKLKCRAPDGKTVRLALQPRGIPRMVFSRSLLPMEKHQRAIRTVLRIAAFCRAIAGGIQWPLARRPNASGTLLRNHV